MPGFLYSPALQIILLLFSSKEVLTVQILTLIIWCKKNPRRTAGFPRNRCWHRDLYADVYWRWLLEPRIYKGGREPELSRRRYWTTPMHLQQRPRLDPREGLPLNGLQTCLDWGKGAWNLCAHIDNAETHGRG